MVYAYQFFFSNLINYMPMIVGKTDSLFFTDNNPAQQQNLLDLITPSNASSINVHTFTQFKQWMNNKFRVKQQLNESSYIKRNQLVKSFKLRHVKSVGYENGGGEMYQSQGKGNMRQEELFATVKRRPSASFQALDLIQEDREHLEVSVRGQSNNRSRKQTDYFQIFIDMPQNLKEHSIRESKSVHSSRSFNGYEQINQYQLRDRIGKGSFAEVYQAIDTEDPKKTKYAVKIMESKLLRKKFFFRKNSQQVEQNPTFDQSVPKFPDKFIKNQIAILKKMSYQYITKLHQVIFDNQKQKVYLVLQYCAGGFINESKERRGEYRKLLQSECKRYFKQLALAMVYIHNVVRIAHRDIKPQNILLSEFQEVRISDFGLGTMDMVTQAQSGTRLFMPPEASNIIQKRQNRTQSADIWALGVTLLITLTGKIPQYKNQIINLPKLIENIKDISHNCRDFLAKCLDINPNTRIKAQQMVDHEWLGMGEHDILRVNNNIQTNVMVTEDQQEHAIKGREKIRLKGKIV